MRRIRASHIKGGFASFSVLLERGQVLAGVLAKDKAWWNIGVEVVVVEVEVLKVGKVHEGGRNLPCEVVIVKVEAGEGGKRSELSRERAFEAIIV